MNEPKKIIYKNLLDHFEPLTEEEQKDLLFILLARIDGCNADFKSFQAMVEIDDYSSIAKMLIKEEKENSLLKRAHQERLEWELSCWL